MKDVQNICWLKIFKLLESWKFAVETCKLLQFYTFLEKKRKKLRFCTWDMQIFWPFYNLAIETRCKLQNVWLAIETWQSVVKICSRDLQILQFCTFLRFTNERRWTFWGSSILQRFSFLSGSNCIVTGMLSFFRAEASPVTAQLEAVRKSSVRTYKIVIFSHVNYANFLTFYNLAIEICWKSQNVWLAIETWQSVTKISSRDLQILFSNWQGRFANCFNLQ